jgi:hypothetical protein
MRSILLGLLIAVVPGTALAVDVPGLGLDNPGLTDGGFGNYAGLGSAAAVKGAKTGSEISDVIGRLRGGQLAHTPRHLDYRFPTFSGAVPISGSQLDATLVPPFALGAVGHVTYVEPSGSYRRQGPFVQAIVYEPDQVKRKAGPGTKSRLQLKQKSHLAFRFGQFGGTGNGYPIFLSRGVQIRDCRALFDVKVDPGKGGTAKMKVKCSGKSAGVEDLKNRLGLILGKKKSGFDLTVKLTP